MGRSYGALEASTVDGKSSELLTVDVYIKWKFSRRVRLSGYQAIERTRGKVV